MALKVVIGTKSGKTYQKELSGEEAEALYGKVLGEEIKGELIGLPGTTLLIRGGSDHSGFPMRNDFHGTQRKKLLISKSTGFKGKLRGKRFDGVRIKKTVCGNTVHEKTNQLNLKALKGDESLAKAFAPAPEETPVEAPAAEE